MGAVDSLYVGVFEMARGIGKMNVKLEGELSEHIAGVTRIPGFIVVAFFFALAYFGSAVLVGWLVGSVAGMWWVIGWG